MKKVLAFFLTVVLCVILLASCGSAHKENKWFLEEKLTECLVGELPTIEKDYVNHNGEDIYVSFTSKEREAYVAEIFEYLKSQNFKHFGTRGEQKDTLAGALTTYYFESATKLSEFYVDGAYRFVYSDGTLDDSGKPIFCIIAIYEYEAKNLKYGIKNFAYNTLITLRYESESSLGGFYVLKEDTHEHTGEWVEYNQYTHCYQYTCGCTLPDRIEEHENWDADMFCDICGYDLSVNIELCDHQWDAGVEVESGTGGYVMEYTCLLCGSKHRETITIIPPTNYFLRNQAGCEWLNEITAEDIAQIKIISGAVGVAPGSLNNIQSSADEAVIARIFEEYYWLDTTPISKMEGQIDGGGGVTVKFILKNGTVKELYINNGNYRDPDDNYFELLFTPNFKDTDNATKAHGFITYLGTGTVYDKDNNAVCEIPIDELEFVESDGCVDAMVTGYYYTVDTEFGILYFDYSNDLFYLKFEEGEVDYIEFYRLVGKNLDELIAYATSPDYSVVMNDDEWLFEDLKSSYKAGETVSVKIGIVYDLGYMLFVNGDRVMDEAHTDGPYWEFIFTMPECDVTIDFKTYDGFLPDFNYAILYEAFWTKNLDADYASIRHYYGKFDSGAIVAMIDCADYDEALWDEKIGDTVIHYNDGNRIIVLYDRELYTLTDAYNNGFITAEDLANIAAKHMEFNQYLYE